MDDSETEVVTKKIIKGRIIIYTSTGCPRCLDAKNKLNFYKLPYHEINLSHFPYQSSELYMKTKQRYLPQIFFNDVFIGSNFHLDAMEEKELNGLINFVIKNSPRPGIFPVHFVDPFLPLSDSDDCSFSDSQLVEFVQNLKTSHSFLENKRFKCFEYQNCFTGRALLAYISKHLSLPQDSGFDIGKRMVKTYQIESVFPQPDLPFLNDCQTFYRVVEDRSSNDLNVGFKIKDVSLDIENFVFSSSKIIAKFYDVAFLKGGRIKSLEKLSEVKAFAIFMKFISYLPKVNLDKLTRDESLVFFINIYNALCIHGYLIFGYPSLGLDWVKFTKKASYNIGGFSFSLSDLKDGLLRQNRLPSGSYTTCFSDTDPRKKWVVEPFNNLIHFALTDGTVSSPALHVFSANSIYEDLHHATSCFLESAIGCQLDLVANRIFMNPIFKIYKNDLGKKQTDLIRFLIRYLPEGTKKDECWIFSQRLSFQVAYSPVSREIQYSYIRL